MSCLKSLICTVQPTVKEEDQALRGDLKVCSGLIESLALPNKVLQGLQSSCPQQLRMPAMAASTGKGPCNADERREGERGEKGGGGGGGGGWAPVHLLVLPRQAPLSVNGQGSAGGTLRLLHEIIIRWTRPSAWLCRCHCHCECLTASRLASELARVMPQSLKIYALLSRD